MIFHLRPVYVTVRFELGPDLGSPPVSDSSSRISSNNRRTRVILSLNGTPSLMVSFGLDCAGSLKVRGSIPLSSTNPLITTQRRRRDHFLPWPDFYAGWCGFRPPVYQDVTSSCFIFDDANYTLRTPSRVCLDHRQCVCQRRVILSPKRRNKMSPQPEHSGNLPRGLTPWRAECSSEETGG